MSVTGNWVNGYGSLIFLTQSDAGAVAGAYTSTTGSSGSYWVVGFANPDVPNDGTGQTLVLNILWRSFSGGTPDPSWHYVSGFGGQMLPLDLVTNSPSLVMIHDLVATVPLKGLVAVPGNYLDKLVYIPYMGGQPSPGQWPPPFTPPSQPDPVDGNWRCIQDPSVGLSLAVQDQQSGYVNGLLTTAAGTIDLVGFTDTGAPGAGLKVQGLTVSALLPDGQTVALAGRLDLGMDALSMAWLQSDGTTAQNSYVQTSFQGMNFRRA